MYDGWRRVDQHQIAVHPQRGKLLSSLSQFEKVDYIGHVAHCGGI